jgi:hypothetical protein
MSAAPEQVIMTQEDCYKLEQFFKRINGSTKHKPIQLLPLDEPLNGLKGIIAFFQEEYKEEAAILFSWKFAEPIQDIYDVTDRAEELLKDCLSNPDWIRCDDVKKLKVGFANHAMSKCRYFSVRTIKGMSKETQQAFSQADKNMPALLDQLAN